MFESRRSSSAYSREKKCFNQVLNALSSSKIHAEFVLRSTVVKKQ
jgi:hypothetical protein